MKSCTFFGHKDMPSKYEMPLKMTIERLVKDERVLHFMVGNQGSFDAMVVRVLNELKKGIPDIAFDVVLAYMPGSGSNETYDTVFPEGLENVPRRFAVYKRNLWMIEQSEIVVVCVTRPFGGAAKFAETAIKKGKRVINIAKM